MNEWLHSIKWQWLFIFWLIHWMQSKTCPIKPADCRSKHKSGLCILVQELWLFKVSQHFYATHLAWSQGWLLVCQPYAYSMKSRFDEKLLRWKAALMKSHLTITLSADHEVLTEVGYILLIVGNPQWILGQQLRAQCYKTSLSIIH